MSFLLPELPYAADSLEKAIDKMTMEIHHGRHHKAYVDNLNAALAGHDQLLSKPVDQLMRDIKEVPESIRQKVINNGGGHANHTLFWATMSPNGGGEPSGRLAEAVKSTFGDFSALKTKIKEAALARFSHSSVSMFGSMPITSDTKTSALIMLMPGGRLPIGMKLVTGSKKAPESPSVSWEYPKSRQDSLAAFFLDLLDPVR